MGTQPCHDAIFFVCNHRCEKECRLLVVVRAVPGDEQNVEKVFGCSRGFNFLGSAAVNVYSPAARFFKRTQKASVHCNHLHAEGGSTPFNLVEPTSPSTSALPASCGSSLDQSRLKTGSMDTEAVLQTLPSKCLVWRLREIHFKILKTEQDRSGTCPKSWTRVYL